MVPENPRLTGHWATQRVLITGKRQDGTLVDVTDQCQFESVDANIAAVSSQGIIEPIADGTTKLRIGYESLNIETAVTIQQASHRTLNFRNQVLPVISSLNCNQMGCHGSPKGKNGFLLSLFAAEPEDDYQMIARGRMSRLVDPVEPERSLLLLKAINQVPHGGGRHLSQNSREYALLADWIAQQTPQGSSDDRKLERIEIFPKQRVVNVGGEQRFLVEAYYSDGSMADVTDLANFTSNDDLIAAVFQGGLAEVNSAGDAIILARFSGQMAVSRLAIPQERSTPFSEFAPNNRIDELVAAKLRRLNILPSDLTSDSQFIRRVYLDTMGTLPSVAEVRGFLADSAPDKRSRLIDELLDRPEFVDRRTLKWADLLRVNSGFPVYLRKKGMWAYYQWVRNRMAQNQPMDEFVHELMTAEGNSLEYGAASFFRASKTKPQETAEQVATLFLGVRLDCAHCHNHPFEEITWNDNLGMGAFFANVRRKRLDTERQDEFVIYQGRGGTLKHPKTRKVVSPTFLDGTVAEMSPNDDPRKVLADWVTKPENPWFARNMANRVWFWLMGRGIVHEPDDMRSTNPPSNPELLDYLAEHFVASGYDQRETYRLILNSRTYQLSSLPNESNKDDHVHCSHYPFRRLESEQMLDAVSQATGTVEAFPGMPRGTRAAELPDTYVRSVFLDLFGRPMRASTCDCERPREMHVGQTMHFMSSEHMEAKLSGAGNRISKLVQEKKTAGNIIDELYLATLSRFPTEEERQRVLSETVPEKARQGWFEDLLWALLNTKEFSFNH